MKFRNKRNGREVVAAQFLATKESFDNIIDLKGMKWRPGVMGTKSFIIEDGDKGEEWETSHTDWVIKNEWGKFYSVPSRSFDNVYEAV